ncbi:MAG: aldo/keto reductase [Candidatus Latescibacteria bacterium]|nr:aldo/keto reductase [Candidatus Latescibacterota bacterium]
MEMIDQVDLGLSGLRVSRLCFGTGTNGWNNRSNQGDLGVDRLAYLLRFAHERGVNFWDTADQYGTHPHVAAALEEVGRENAVITTKTVSRTGPEVKRDVERFLQELRTDYIDILLLHCLTEAGWPAKMQGPMETLSRLKEQGVIRALGVSCHDFGAFQTTARTAWVDVVLARVNYAGHAMDAGPEQVVPVIEEMAAAGKGIYGMKIVGGGSELTQDPARAVRFVLDIPAVHSMVLGMMDEEQICANIGLVGEAVAA